MDEKARELYIADGYGNRRVIVFDSDTGKFKRMWGAYGNAPSDADPGPYDPGAAPGKQFRTPVHCVHLSNDGLVYVCDRVNDRIQVFTKEGKFLKEFFLRKQTLGNGSAYDLTFSRDQSQGYLLVADGENNVIWTVRRSDGAILGAPVMRVGTQASSIMSMKLSLIRAGICTRARWKPAKGFRNSF